jgi:hypothetical protein
MGNVINMPSESDSSVVEQKDREYLELQCAAVFNDDYVTKIFNNLPVLDDYVPVDKNAKVDKPESNMKLQRIMDVLTSQTANGDNQSLDKFQVNPRPTRSQHLFYIFIILFSM